MVRNLGWDSYFRQDSQGGLSEEVTFKLGLEQKKNLLKSRRTFQAGGSCPKAGQGLPCLIIKKETRMVWRYGR